MPPKQKQVLPRGGGAPKPKNMSTTATAPKNDPLHMEALLPNPGQESRPVAQELRVYPGFYAMSDLSLETHRHIAAIDTRSVVRFQKLYSHTTQLFWDTLE